jgi:hypothetical protein
LAAGKSAAGRAAAERASSSTVGGSWWGAAPEEIAAFTEALRASERARLPTPAPATALGAPALPVRSRAADAFAASHSFAPPSQELTNPTNPARCVERAASCLAFVEVAASSAPTSAPSTAPTVPAAAARALPSTAPTSLPSTAPTVPAAARALLLRLVEPSAAAVLAACDGDEPSVSVVRTALLGQQWPSAWVHAVSSPLCEALLSGATLGEALMTMAIGCGDGEALTTMAADAWSTNPTNPTRCVERGAPELTNPTNPARCVERAAPEAMGAEAMPTQPAPVPATNSSEASDEMTISASEALDEIDRARSSSIELHEVFMRDYDDDDSATVPTADVPTSPLPHSASVPTADDAEDAGDAGAGAGMMVSRLYTKALIAGLLSPQMPAGLPAPALPTPALVHESEAWVVESPVQLKPRKPKTARVPREAPTTARVPQEAPTTARVPQEAPTTARMPQEAPTTARMPHEAPTTARRSDEVPGTAPLALAACALGSALGSALSVADVAAAEQAAEAEAKAKEVEARAAAQAAEAAQAAQAADAQALFWADAQARARPPRLLLPARHSRALGRRAGAARAAAGWRSAGRYRSAHCPLGARRRRWRKESRPALQAG